MTVRVYTSADGSAPVLTNTNEMTDIPNLYKKCLVEGYGSATAAGWSTAFEDATFSVLRPGAGVRPYLQIRKASYAAAIGFETMSAVNTGTNPTRSDNASFHDLLCRTSGSGSTPRPWVMVADERTAYFFCDGYLNGTYHISVFGDFYSYKSGDAYNSLFAAAGNTKDTNPFLNPGWSTLAASLGTAIGTTYTVRSYLQTGSQIAGGFRGDQAVISGANLRGLLPYPNPAGSKIWLSPIYVNDTGLTANRGKLRGLWQWLHPIAAVADRDTFSGTGEFAGKTFMIVKQVGDVFGSLVDGLWVVETSSTWLTN